MKIKLYIRVRREENRIIIFTLWLHQWVVKTECTICTRILLLFLVLSCLVFIFINLRLYQIIFNLWQSKSLLSTFGHWESHPVRFSRGNHHSKATPLHCNIRRRVLFILPLSSQDWFDMNKCFVNVVALSSSLLCLRCCSSWSETTSAKNKANWSTKKLTQDNITIMLTNCRDSIRGPVPVSWRRVIALQGRCISRFFTLTRSQFVFKGKNSGEAKVNEMKWIWIRRQILRKWFLF